jgi:hypothetical protein
MENEWSYKGFQIRDGLKPGSTHFQYFYVVSEQAKKKCNYCIWIVDEALTDFGDFASIVSAKRETWDKWVKGKIAAGDFGNKVLKYDRNGETEIELSEMTTHLSMG